MTKTKTRKAHHKKSNHKHYDYEVTFHGLNNWYECKFEKLGWMILAQKKGMLDKVMEYQNSVKRLHMALDEKIKEIHDKDKKMDLIIMRENVETLLEHLKKDF